MTLIKCSKCGNEISDNSEKCIHCGEDVGKMINCKECGSEISSNSNICPNCGNKISKNFIEKIKEKKIDRIHKMYIIKYGLIAFVFIAIFLSVMSGKMFDKIDLEIVYAEIKCNSTYCEIASDASYISIDTNPYDLDDYYSISANEYVKRANIELGFTEALYSRMENTRALDGTLNDENDKVKVSWTYHPDKGLEVLYMLK